MVFFIQFLSNNYKHNKNNYTIRSIIMSKMIEVNNVTRKTSVDAGYRILSASLHPPGLTGEFDSLIIQKNF